MKSGLTSVRGSHPEASLTVNRHETLAMTESAVDGGPADWMDERRLWILAFGFERASLRLPIQKSNINNAQSEIQSPHGSTTTMRKKVFGRPVMGISASRFWMPPEMPRAALFCSGVHEPGARVEDCSMRTTAPGRSVRKP